MGAYQEIMIAAARLCLGTPFHHQGRVPQVGLDCIGLVVVALRAAGIVVQDRHDYGRSPQGNALHEAFIAHGFQHSLPLPLIAPASIILCSCAGVPQHVALITTPTMMIHAYAPAGGVIETIITPAWRRRFIGVYNFQES
jgi:cell wall-associated NlpC family hydrolase